VLKDLRERPEKAVIVVSHSGFLRLGVTGRWFMNADYRVFDFVEGNGIDRFEDGGEGVGIREWDGEEKGGLGWSLEERVVLGEGLPEEGEEKIGEEVIAEEGL
jgi:hypothetical protein